MSWNSGREKLGNDRESLGVETLNAKLHDQVRSKVSMLKDDFVDKIQNLQATRTCEFATRVSNKSQQPTKPGSDLP